MPTAHIQVVVSRLEALPRAPEERPPSREEKYGLGGDTGAPPRSAVQGSHRRPLMSLRLTIAFASSVAALSSLTALAWAQTPAPGTAPDVAANPGAPSTELPTPPAAPPPPPPPMAAPMAPVAAPP